MDNAGLLEKISHAVRAAHVHAFGGKGSQAGVLGDTSRGYDFSGKTFVVVDVANLPDDHDASGVPLGELLIEGTISGTNWFELCRIKSNGVFNLAALVASQAGIDTPGVLNGPSRISVYKLRVTVTKLPPDRDPVRVTILGVV